eukprot:scaffold6754_cov148-Amphora_coffeaeformis.AAC.11
MLNVRFDLRSSLKSRIHFPTTQEVKIVTAPQHATKAPLIVSISLSPCFLVRLPNRVFLCRQTLQLVVRYSIQRHTYAGGVKATIVPPENRNIPRYKDARLEGPTPRSKTVFSKRLSKGQFLGQVEKQGPWIEVF